jgi:hypothetical protein
VEASVIELTAEMRAAAARRMGVDELDLWTEAALVDVLTIAAQKQARDRQRVAEEIARAIEVAQGIRCPECGGKAASMTWKGATRFGRCGGGHTWQHRTSDWVEPAAIARAHADGAP